MLTRTLVFIFKRQPLKTCYSAHEKHTQRATSNPRTPFADEKKYEITSIPRDNPLAARSQRHKRNTILLKTTNIRYTQQRLYVNERKILRRRRNIASAIYLAYNSNIAKKFYPTDSVHHSSAIPQDNPLDTRRQMGALANKSYYIVFVKP